MQETASSNFRQRTSRLVGARGVARITPPPVSPSDWCSHISRTGHVPLAANHPHRVHQHSYAQYKFGTRVAPRKILPAGLDNGQDISGYFGGIYRVCRKKSSVVSCSTAKKPPALTVKWLILKGRLPARMAVKMHHCLNKTTSRPSL